MSGQMKIGCVVSRVFLPILFSIPVKSPITKHFLEYFIKYFYDLRDVFYRSDQVCNQYCLLPSTMKEQLCGKMQEKNIKAITMTMS